MRAKGLQNWKVSKSILGIKTVKNWMLSIFYWALAHFNVYVDPQNLTDWKCTTSYLINATKSIGKTKDFSRHLETSLVELIWYILNLKKKVRTLSYNILLYIKLVVLELQSPKNLHTKYGTMMLSAVFVTPNCMRYSDYTWSLWTTKLFKALVIYQK